MEINESGSLKFFIDYTGPLGGKNNHIKTDIGKGEKLEFNVVKRTMLNDYSDLQEEKKVAILSYSLEEIVIEKMAALMGRTIPRDLYDFKYLTNIEGIELQDVFIEFQQKAKHKGQDPKEFGLFLLFSPLLESFDWNLSVISIFFSSFVSQ